MTDSPPAPRATLTPRGPLHRRFFVKADADPGFLEWWTILWGIATVAGFIGVNVFESSLYESVKVDSAASQAGVGFIQCAVAGVMFIAATLWRWGHPLRSVLIAAGVAAAITVAAAVLPHLVAGSGWVTTLLGSLFGLSFLAAGGVFTGTLALYLPAWWAGWHRRDSEHPPM